MRGRCVHSWVVELILVALELTLVERVEDAEAVELHGISEKMRGSQVGNSGRDTDPESERLVWAYNQGLRQRWPESESVSLIC